MLKLGDLLDHEQFSLRLRTAIPTQLERRVAGAHVVEVRDPMRWLQEDWVALTSGLRLRRTADQREFVRGLADGQVAALGFAVDVTFKDVPRAIVEEAHNAGLPLFEVPLRTRFHDMMAFVNDALLNHDLYVLRRAFSMQRYLIDAVSGESPEDELISRLASLLQSTVLLFADDGTVEASEGSAPAGRIWARMSSAEPRHQRFVVDGWTVLASPVAARDGASNWLAVATRRPAVHEHLARPVIEAAESLLGVVRLGRHAAALGDRALRSELLAELLDRDDEEARSRARDPGLKARLKTAGFTPRGDTRMLVVEALGDESGLHAVERTLDREWAQGDAAYLLTSRQTRVAALVAEEVAEEASIQLWIGSLSRDGVAVNVGVGRRISSVEEAGRSFRDAMLCLDDCRRRTRRGAVLRFEDLDLACLALAQGPPGALLPKIDALIEPLRRRPLFEEALRAYFDANLDVVKAAQALHLHHNSLRYRLAQIEKLLGVELRNPATIANLHLALLASPAVEDPPADPVADDAPRRAAHARARPGHGTARDAKARRG